MLFLHFRTPFKLSAYFVHCFCICNFVLESTFTYFENIPVTVDTLLITYMTVDTLLYKHLVLPLILIWLQIAS